VSRLLRALRTAVAVATLAACADSEGTAPAGRQPAENGPLPSDVPPRRPPAAPDELSFAIETVAQDPALFLSDSWASPAFSPDGEWISFHGRTADGTAIGMVRLDGKGGVCLTCESGVDARRPIWSPDGARIYFVNDKGFHAVELASKKVRKVKGIGTPVILERDRWLIVSPDGSKLAWAKIWPDGFRMVMGELVVAADEIRVEDLRVLHPPEVADPGDGAAWARAFAWYEPKAFKDGGRTLVFAGTPAQGGNLDLFELDLQSGAVARLTHHGEWDEGGELSPDERWLAFETTRAHDTLAVMTQVPLPSLLDFALVHPCTAATLSGPWWALHEVYLAGSAGDGGSPAALRLSETEQGFAVRNGPHWHPDGKRIIWGELSYETGANRIRLLTFHQGLEPADPVAIDSTPLPVWAPAIADVQPRDMPDGVWVDGPAGGQAHLDYGGIIALGTFKVAFERYSTDGRQLLDGSMRAHLPLPGRLNLEASVVLSGAHTGYLDVDVSIKGTHVKGYLRSEKDGNVLERSF
jgi:Tol biopolymer transport system component